MEALQNFLTKWLTPVASRIERQKHLQSIKDGMIGVIPFIVIGSMCLLPTAVMNLLGSGPVYDALGVINPFFTKISSFTTDFISLYAAYLIARSLAKRYKLDSLMAGLTAVVVQLILCGFTVEGGMGTSYIGSSGLFTSIIAGLVSVEVTRFLISHHIVITLPDSVPSMVSESFSALLPIFFNAAIASAVSLLCTTFADGQVFPALVMTVLAPAISTMDTLPALLVVMFITQLLWFFGLHGPSITSAVWTSFALTYAAENAANYAAGLPVTHVFTFGFYYNVLSVCGSGLTLALVLFMMFSKSETYKAVGRAAIVPSLFGINEPVIFGAPIVMNPFMFIPFVFGPLVITVIAWFAFTGGLVGMPILNPPSFMPPGVGVYLMTLDWRAVVLVFVLLFVMGLIYYPFFKVMERDQLAQESQETTN